MRAMLQRDIIDFLRPLPQFQNESGRTALLITAGLNNILASIELRGSADEFVPLLVRQLEAFGVAADDEEPALVVLLRSLAEKLGTDKQETVREFCRRLREETPASAFASCPYRGLSAFREEDEAFFFGRETYTRKLAELVQATPFVAVLGASGSGKSSLVYAGLIPQLRRQLPSREGLGVGKWQIATLRPLTNPWYEMASALIPLLKPDADEIDAAKQIEKLTAALQANDVTVAGILKRIARKSPENHLLLAIDQFEELYAPENASACGNVIEHILQIIADSSIPAHIVITLRSDFLDQANRHPDFSHLIAEHNLLVPAMNADELRAAIAEPAKTAGQPLSGEVVELLIEQTKEREGVLPLLEFALTQIWDGMARGVEPADTLKQIGGVGGALANKAKELFGSLNPTEQQIARRAFLAMTRLGEGTKDTRRRAALAEMVSHQNAPDEVRNVLRVFAQPGARLLTLTEDAAEITHEALFEHWDSLKAWIDANRDDLRFQRQVNDAAQAWDAQGRPDGSLWRSPNLDLLKTFHARAAADMTALQMAFFQESERKEKQTRFRKRITRAGLIILTVVSVIAAMWAMRSERMAQEERTKAEINEIEALNQTAKALFASNDELPALLTAIKAGTKAIKMRLPLSLQENLIELLREIVNGIHEENRLIGHKKTVSSVVFSPDGKILASGSWDHTIKLWHVEDGLENRTLQGHEMWVNSLSFSPDGKLLASGSMDKTVRFWNVTDGKCVKILQTHDSPIMSIAFSPDGKLLASGSADKTIKIWDVQDIQDHSTRQKIIFMNDE